MAEIAPQSLYAAQEKIYPREIDGVFARLRIAAMVVLLGGYYLAAWVTWDGRQALLFDLPARKFYVLGLVLWPQDFFFLSWLLIIAALSLFFFTALAGRVWCGYACPQTVWTEAFLWMERLVEGRGPARRKLDAGPWTTDKLWRKTAKQALWIAFALWTGFTFVGYFTPIRALGREVHGALARRLGDVLDPVLRLRDLRQRGLHARAGVQVHVPVRALPERDVRPRHAGRVVRRAPRRAARLACARQRSARAQQLGDCIDCRMCVQVCPTGIDIRKGLQYECIACAACIDACDGVMDKMQYAARPDPLLDAARDRRPHDTRRCARESSCTRRC